MTHLLARPELARLRSAKRITMLDINVAGQGGLNPLAPGLGKEPNRCLER